MAYTTPRTWVAGEVPTAAQFNANIRDNVAFLANPPACRVYHNTTQSAANSTEVSVAFNSERYDTASMHDTVTNNTRITFTTAGLFVVGAHIEFAAAADYNFVYAYIRLNGTTGIGSSSIGDYDTADAPRLNPVTVYKVAVNDYMEIRAQQANAAAAARNIGGTPAMQCEFFATWIGLG